MAYSLAGTQAGVVARQQLIGRGLSSDMIGNWVRTGYLFRFLPGVYSLGRPADKVESFWMAGVLFAGKASLLAGESAAQALGLTDSSGRNDVVRPNGVRRLLRGEAPHQESRFLIRRGRLEPADSVSIGPVPVMDPARVLIDLAGQVSTRRLRRYFIEAGRAGLLTRRCLDRIESRSIDFKGRSGLLKLKEYWDPTTGRIRSILEGEFKLLCAEQGIPAPETNYPVGRYEVDAIWLGARLIVELDGRKFHGDAVALEADSGKTRYLREIGFRVLRFTWNDVIQRPEWVADEIRRQLGSIYMGIAHTTRTQI